MTVNQPPPRPAPLLTPPAPLAIGQKFLLPATVVGLDHVIDLEGTKAVAIELAGCGWCVYITEERLRAVMNGGTK